MLNRRGLEARLVLEARRAQRDLTQVMALVIDVDQFKAVNTRFGHAIGDQILCAIARQIEIACRATDHCARVGGDEFLVVLPDVSLMAARNIAERTTHVGACDRLMQCKQGGRDRVSIASTGRPRREIRGDRSPDAPRDPLTDASLKVEESEVVELATAALAGRESRRHD